MVFTNKYTQILMERFPNFAKSISLKETIELSISDDGIVSACTVFTGLTRYVFNDLIKKYQAITQEELDIYAFVEEIRVKFSHYSDTTDEGDFDGAACVCFLENLQNRAGRDGFEYSRFIPYLGEKSKEFCRAWDEFTGVKSPGL